MTNSSIRTAESNGRGVPAEERTVTEPSTPGETLSTYLCCLAGAAIGALLVLVSLPTLLEMTRPLGGLSSTAIAFVFVFAWLVGWAAIEFAWETLLDRSG